ETVRSTGCGKAERCTSNGSACRKLQYVSGNSGLINKTFIARPPPGQLRILRLSKPIQNQKRVASTIILAPIERSVGNSYVKVFLVSPKRNAATFIAAFCLPYPRA